MNYVLAGRSIGAVLGRSAGAAVPWWMAAGVTPTAAYAPKGAASLAASYTNLANPGTYDAAPGVAPTFNTATGWTFNGTSQYLTTGIVPASTWTMIVKFNGATTTNARTLAGLFDATPNTRFYLRSAHAGGTVHAYGYGNAVSGAGSTMTSGTLAIAANKGYKDGAFESNLATWLGNPTIAIIIGGLNQIAGFDNTTAFAGNITSLWIGNTTLSAAQVAAQSAAMP